MTEVGFYHLTRSTLVQALPRLLVRTLAAGQRALVLGPRADDLARLSEALWAQSEWLPHGTIEDGDADLQPIWLSTDPTPVNSARYLFLVGNAALEELSDYDRVFDLFDGTSDAAVQAARSRWKAVRTRGNGLAYWQQTETGWQKKA